MKHFDVLVVGGGHAGVEAAASAARMGARTALLTLDRSKIGVMSCNPAIGGLGKGHLVREIDALDGIMARAADAAGIQFRLLNRSKGPAVQGPRTQADRKLYRLAVQTALAGQAGLEILKAEVVGLIIEGGRIAGVRTRDDSIIYAPSVVLTGGTFLNGLIHIGDRKIEGGRMGDAASVLLGQHLREVLGSSGRLKTGTPPRLDGKTIDWAQLERQEADEAPVMLSFLSSKPTAAQIACGITHTNERTHDIIRRNLHRSAMYGGHIDGVGPRYCPSIEDKIVRFSDKTSHQIFLEPEGLDDDTVYPNGISSSLPIEVQDEYVRSIKGLGSARILQPAYAIEYDFFDPTRLKSSLMTRSVPGLFLAGQINGTTGYEEAGAQGLVAGLNAAANARDLPEISFSRTESYIGVLIDDLVTRGVTEPYRMFTSRAEYRLALRADNADQRLTGLGVSIGCVGAERQNAFVQKQSELSAARAVLSQASFLPRDLSDIPVRFNSDGGRRTGLQLLATAGVTAEMVANLVPDFAGFQPEIRQQVATDALYAQYLLRQDEEAAALRRDESRRIPNNFVYRGLAGLSNELAGKLEKVRPESLAHAARIEGMTPAALTLILAHLRKLRKDTAA